MGVSFKNPKYVIASLRLLASKAIRVRVGREREVIGEVFPCHLFNQKLELPAFGLLFLGTKACLLKIIVRERV